MILNIKIITPTEVAFEGEGKSVVFPGESGTFEILPFHKRLLARLRRGEILIDGRSLPILRGVVKVDRNRVDAVVEELKERVEEGTSDEP